jgi:hypothetical protein
MVFSFLDPFYAAGKRYTELGLFFLSQPVARKHVKRHHCRLNQRLFYMLIKDIPGPHKSEYHQKTTQTMRKMGECMVVFDPTVFLEDKFKTPY